MKYTLLFLLVFPFFAQAQTESQIIEQARGLIANKKYLSAWKALEGFDPNNTKPDLAILKEQLVLNYHVSTFQLQLFGLRDLNASDDVSAMKMDYNADSISTRISYEADLVIDGLLKVHPKNFKLYRALGDYYYAVYMAYGNRWIIGSEALFERIWRNYNVAVDNGEGDFLAYYALGYIASAMKQYDMALPHLKKSIELESKFGQSHYQMAIALLNTNNAKDAIPSAQTAISLLTDKVYKSDAARVLATAYEQVGDTAKCVENYELSRELDPTNFSSLKYLLRYYLKTNNAKAAMLRADIFNYDPTEESTYAELVSAHISTNHGKDLVKFLEARAKDYKSDDFVTAHINLYLGSVYLQMQDKKNAKESLEKSKKAFSKVLSEKHPIFKRIDDYISQTK